MKNSLAKELEKNQSEIVIDRRVYSEEEIIANIARLMKKTAPTKLLHNNDEMIEHVINACNMSDERQRYEYIYDVICDYLDKAFARYNYCQFVNDVCISGQANDSHYHAFGCCFIKPRNNPLQRVGRYFLRRQGVLFLNVQQPTKCPHLAGKDCQIKAIACKLFTCNYLQKQGINFNVDDFVLLRAFLNNRQKRILQYSFYHDKQDVIDQLIKFS